ncbi:unnamed protein product [Allacma fusca]|uniref:Serine/threonine-protein kinase TOR n=1 Tax=Allacma fusca TaxID=39272 RepID=A0A8J2NZ21_9HEXA|nr:unnamed protein product [Allacma fusca]
MAASRVPKASLFRSSGSASASVMTQFVQGLKSKNEETRLRAAKDLYHYVTTELREVSVEELTAFMDEFNHHIFDMVSSPDVSEKKGAILAIESLIGVDVGNTSTRISRFANYLRNTFPSSDIEVMELAAKAVGKLALVSGTYSTEYIDVEVKRAFEWLSDRERHEGKRLAAVLVLRELAVSTPTFFFQQVHQFFEVIFNAVRDPKPNIREGGVRALRYALVVTAQREKTQTQTQYYKQCYEETKMGFTEMSNIKGVSKEDRAHGSLLVLNELLRVANSDWERHCDEITQKFGWQPVNRQETQRRYYFPRRRLLKVAVADAEVDQPQKIYSESLSCKNLIHEYFTDICKSVLDWRNSRNSYIQQTLFVLLPRLAAFDNLAFSNGGHLNVAVNYLLTNIRLKPEAFVTIGLVALAVGHGIKQWISKIMEVVKASLPDVLHSTVGQSGTVPGSQTRKSSRYDQILNCVTLLTISLKSTIKQDISELLEPILQTGLSQALTSCLTEVTSQIPSLKKDISDGLLKILSSVLMNQPWRHPGLPPMPSFEKPRVEIDSGSIVLALNTLARFDLDGNSLIQFVKHCADIFLTSECKEIRLESVRSCSVLLRSAIAGLEGRYSHTVTSTVADVLNKLLVVGVTDADQQVRFTVFENLDEIFDMHLAQPENLSALFLGLHDEVFEIREICVCTLGRLSLVNPAYVLPGLRKILIQILTELEYSGLGRNKEQSARILGHLVATSPKLIRSYREPVLRALVPKLKDPDPNPGVVINILVALGDLAQVTGPDMTAWVPDLLLILLEMLNDTGAPTQRGFALWTLGQLVEHTGCVITPYQKFPNLLDTLLSFLKTEQQHFARRGTLRVLGLLGALDPYKHKMNLGVIDVEGNAIALVSMTDPQSEIESVQEMNTSEMLIHMSSANLDEFYPAIAIATLMRIIRDNTLAQHHTSVVQAVTFVFKSLNISCVTYIPQVIPSLIQVIRTTEMQYKDFLFQQLGMLIAIVKQHIRNYLDDIFSLIKDFWMINPSLQVTIILVVEQVALALGSEFKIYLAKIIPLILKVLVHDNSRDRVVTANLMNALQKFGTNLDEFLHLILPPIVKLLDSPDVPVSVKKIAIETLDHLSSTLNFSDFSSRILHSFIRILDNHPELREATLDTLTSLVSQFGDKLKVFIPMVQRVLKKHGIKHSRYDSLILYKQKCDEDQIDGGSKLLIPSSTRAKKAMRHMGGLTPADTTSINRFHVSTANLQKAWTATRRVSKEDWLEWLRRLSIDFLKESPSPSLRACHNLAQTYAQLPRDLFNAAFVSCWTELQEEQQNELISSLKQSLLVEDLPEINQTILNLAEFMEHCEKGPLPLEPEFLGERAMQCSAYAKALHYKEEQFTKNPTSEVLEELISINNKLQNKEAAAGLLEYAQKHYSNELKVQEQWYERLHDWEKALELYKSKEGVQDSLELSLGKMRCLEALADWSLLEETARTQWSKSNDMSIAGFAAAATWGLGKWSEMEKYVNFIPRDSQDGCFYRALLAIWKSDYNIAEQLIDSARDILDTELTALSSESYQRAYNSMVNVQMLAELEEVIMYKVVPERREGIKKMWWERLMGCQRVVEDWQKILQVRSIVLTPQEDIRTYLKYASICRKSRRLKLSEKILTNLLESTTDETVSYAWAKHLWSSNRQEEAFSKLQDFVKTESKNPDLRKLLARCYLRLGEWEESLHGLNSSVIENVLKYYSTATNLDPTWYKAWHAYAYMNFEAVLFWKNNQDRAPETDKRVGLTPAYISEYTVPAVQAFVRSISLSSRSSLQDTLRLLTLWFDFGQWHEVYDALVEGIRTIHVDNWLQVIPQLIARIDTPRHLVGKLIHQLLTDIGKHHPQALIYPLTVSSTKSSSSGHTAAGKILKCMCEHSQTLVQQAVMVSEELIRVAILWHEMWHEGLEDASRLYFGERNVQGMFNVLEPLHARLERGPQTMKETSFNQAYGRDLNEAQDWCRRYKVSGNVRDLNQAWDLYYHVFKRVSRQLPQLISLELQYVSPKLLKSRDLELAVPGSYVPGKPVIKIAQVSSFLQVITSKQRPRRLVITGSNGKDFAYLLKGHEDLRQDERVMQLFGLVNTLLLSDPETFRRNLTIQRYAVIPLSPNSGLIGWVPHCDTLHTLIHDYREKKKILLNIEHRIMLRMAPDYDHLTLMQKVEVFEHALEHTQGDDLARLLWLKSPSSEVWFDRRTNYTRSLAVMSMVGYVLGLGDRHPSNLMLDRQSGKIVHIDFGDCFEVAMTREKFPERIPFRLTRMLINAMEITGIDGTYRCTCESVLRVLRHNKDSLMAVLEAFVYDPLLNWKLMGAAPKTKRSKARNVELGSSVDTEEPNAASVGASAGNQIAGEPDINSKPPEALNKKALAVVTRVKEKLTGRDFGNEEAYSVNDQVKLLILNATSHENLCQCYIGWCPFW